VADFHLYLVSRPGVNEPRDFEELTEFVTDHDPGVSASVVEDAPNSAPVTSCPALTVSPAPVRWVRPGRGPLLQGRPLSKSQEYHQLEATGVPVPRWMLVTPTSKEPIRGLGPYVVIKPDRGARGADVRIVSARRVRWSPPRTGMGQAMGGVLGARVVQEFIHTGPWPRSYRVVTLFGEVLACLAIEAAHSRQPLPSRYAFRELGDAVSIVSSGRGCTFALADDAGVLDLAARAAQAFPRIPLLGIDIVRDHDTGAAYVVEANSIGYTWLFSSRSGRALQEQFGLDLEAQFDGRRRAARALAAATRKYAE